MGGILLESVGLTHPNKLNFYVGTTIYESFVNVGGVASQFVHFKGAIKFVAAATNRFFILAAFHLVGEELNFIAIKHIGFCVWIFNTRAAVHGASGIALAVVFGFSKACS